MNADFINMDKAYNYEKKIKTEINRINKKKSVLSAININTEGGNKILYNNFVNDTNKSIHLKLQENVNEKKKKKCCCWS